MQSCSFPLPPEALLARHQPDRPVLFLSPEALQKTARRFLNGFPGLVTYAVKANPHHRFLGELANAGLRAFDVASPEEMRLVRLACADADLHYNNPVRARSEIAAGVDFGVRSWSVDDEDALAKLGAVPRGEVAVRFKLSVPGAAYDFGSKFGATPRFAASLLRKVADMGFAPALCFHPGTQCTDPDAWRRYVAAAADICRAAGVHIARLNVGGGFPADRGQGAPDLEAFFKAIDSATKKAFGAQRPALVCEPGRAMVASAATLAVRIKARRGQVLYLNDGIYGGLTELRDMGPSGLIRVCDSDGRARLGRPMVFEAFGPTCDSLDRVPNGLTLPEDVSEEDYVLIDGMGAYSNALSSSFNGYGLEHVQTVNALSGHFAQAR